MKSIFYFLIAVLPLCNLAAQEVETETDNSPQKGNNIIRLVPFTAMDVSVGMGIGYERFLTKEQNLSIVLPFSFIFQNSFFSTTTRPVVNYYFTPGVKFYPFEQGRFSYAVGPSLMFGFNRSAMDVMERDFNGNLASTETLEYVHFRAGVLINNYVNFQISKTFNVGLEGGLGMRYVDIEKYTLNDVTRNHGFDITGQFSMTLGLQF